MKYEKMEHLVLRLGVAFAFLYPAIDALFSPDSWIGYFPTFLRGHVPDMVLLHTFGAMEATIALWILSDKKIFLPSLVATAVLLGIVTFDFSQFEIVFRDITIAAASLSLAIGALRHEQV